MNSETNLKKVSQSTAAWLYKCQFKNLNFLFLKKYLFIWLHQVLVGAHGIFAAPCGI